MNFGGFYHGTCPECDHANMLLAMVIRELDRRLKLSSRGHVPVALVCERCKRAFPFDLNRVESMIEVAESPGHNQAIWGVMADCSDANCDLRTEVFAIRSGHARPEQVFAEARAWQLTGITCDRGHPVVMPAKLELHPLLQALGSRTP